MKAGHINDNEEQQLVPGYGTIAIGIVKDNRKILGDVTPKGRQRYAIYFPSACDVNLDAGTPVIFDEKEVKVKGLGRRRIKITIADNVRKFTPREWEKGMKEMEEEQPQEQH